MGHPVRVRSDDARVRPASDDDSLAVVEVWLRSRRASIPAIPPPVHTDEEVRAWFASVVVPRGDTWVAEEEETGTVVAMMVLDDGWVSQLYVDPDWTGGGIGSRLIEVAKRRCPEGLDLWMFESNVEAARFYERHGFTAVERTDGAANEEGAPDVHYRWRSA